jgi:nitrite reductase (NADH) large subunit
MVSLPATQPVVIVGTGPVGMRAADELARRAPQMSLVVFGAEPWEPYDRVRLSSLLAGEIRLRELDQPPRLAGSGSRVMRWNCPIRSIDRAARMVRDASGHFHEYSKLVLATGSTPHVPNIPGRELPGVYTFRNLDDAQRLMARQAHSRHTIVMGGGLLGMEAARAMQRFNTRVRVVELGDRLMAQQLDAGAAGFFHDYVLQQGIEVELRNSVARILGKNKVEGIVLSDGREFACDTVVIATGIRPNAGLARDAGLETKRGIVIGDDTRTSDPCIFAVGECAQHRGIVYGLVAPGLEQATVAAHVIAGGKARYVGSVANTKLKVLGLDVYSLGNVMGRDRDDREYAWQSPGQNIYRKLVVRRGRCVGVISIGRWPALPRVQDFVNRRRRVLRRHIRCFRETGFIWSPKGQPEVVHWPASATVCNCTGVTRGDLSSAIASGCNNLQLLAEATRASTVCGSCKRLLAELLGSHATIQATPGYRALLAVSLVTVLTLALANAAGPLPYAQSFDVPWRWDEIWRNGLFKQISGFTVLGLSVFGLIMSLRKRIPGFRAGGFPGWRLLHVVLGAMALFVLLVHTGARFGHNLNFWLMLTFTGLMLTGAATSSITALEHRLQPAEAKRARGWGTWLHILLFWPLPVLLGFHVLKSYYF